MELRRVTTSKNNVVLSISIRIGDNMLHYEKENSVFLAKQTFIDWLAFLSLLQATLTGWAAAYIHDISITLHPLQRTFWKIQRKIYQQTSFAFISSLKIESTWFLQYYMFVDLLTYFIIVNCLKSVQLYR